MSFQRGNERAAGKRASRRRVIAPRHIMLIGVGLVALGLYGVLHPPSFVGALGYMGYDEMVRFVGGALPPPEVAVVDVDEASLAALGQWPWPRFRIAALIDGAAALGARSIAVDFLFSERDRLPLDAAGRLYEEEHGRSPGPGAAPDDVHGNDRILAAAIARHKAVLGSSLMFGEGVQATPGDCGTPLKVVLRALPGTDGAPPVSQAAGGACPLPELAAGARFVAAANSLPDSDGRVRRMPLVLRSREGYVPGLALAALLAAWDEDQVSILWAAAGVLELRIRDVVIPTDLRGNLLIPYRALPTDRFRHISAVDLLEGRVPRERLQDKIVFIGSSADGLHDAHPTPNLRRCPGVDLHAFAADAVLRRDFFVEPAWVTGMQAVIVLVVGLLVSALMAWAPITVGAGVSGAMSVALTAGSWMLLKHGGVFFSPVPGLGMLLGGCLLLTLLRLRQKEQLILEDLRELSLAQNCALLGLVSISEIRDPETGQHITRTQHFVRVLAEHLGKTPKYRRQLTARNIESLFKSAPLHDIGKVGIPDSVLLKPGRLTDDEFNIIKGHTRLGYTTLARAEKMAGLSHDVSFLRFAKEVARSHHEKWDGTGYPDGLSGEEIPLSARLMALADVYDALRAKRVYKEPMTHEKAREIICEGRGRHFDPDVVDAFLALEQPFQDIISEHADSEESEEL
ncbi:MAG: CHASE2 domain-containing protein [Candidatus Hydrogenedentes bacterium]|nr:CHASE2 domain-containing protein [Candidatus Hydrogenedentota bacterium]